MPNSTARYASALILLTLIAYAPAMRGGFIWDDDDYVTANANLRSVDGLWNIWLSPRTSPQYYPLVHTSLWIEHRLWGTSPAGYHIVNILLHAGAAILLWRLLVQLEIPGAWLAAALWAIHPVQAESVVWITERKNVLSAVFYFASALCFMTWASRAGRRDYLLAFALFAGALLSKTVTCSLPAALALILWWKHGRLSNRHWLALAPMFALGAALGLFTAYWERDWVRAVGPEWDYSLIDRVLIAGRAIWFYATSLVLPVNLSFIYPMWTIDPRLPWQWAFPVGVVVALVALWLQRDRWGRGPLVAALIFVGTLVPALGFFNIYPMRYSLVADHFQYHANCALLSLIAAGLWRVLQARAYFVLAPLLILTFVRSATLSHSDQLWLDTVEKNPDSWMVNLNVAKMLAGSANDETARPFFERQVALAPHLPETHWNMGVNLARRGMLNEALAEYDLALEIDPRFPQARYARGRVLVRQARLDEAITELQRAVEFKPDYALAHLELAEILARQHRPDEARAHFEQAVMIDPSLERYRAATLTPQGR